MRRWLIALAVVPLLLLVACGDDNNTDDNASSSSSSGGGPQTLEVYVDSPDTSTVPAAFLGYFPAALTAHPGDTLDFEAKFTGEPHTVTFGTLVDEGFAAMKGSSASSSASG